MRALAAAAFLCAVAIPAAGCSSGTAAPPVRTASSASTPASTPTGGGAGGTAPATPTPASPVPPSWPTTPRTATGVATPTPGSVAVGRHPAYDRLVFHFTGGLPGYDIRYVKQVVADGSGLPVPLPGTAFLHIVFHPVTTQQPGPGTGTLDTSGFPVLLRVAPAGAFEGYASYGAGLSRTVGFRVFTLTNPDRVVIDFSHG